MLNYVTQTVLSFLYQKYVQAERTLFVVRRYAFDVSALVFVMVIGTYVFFPSVANADVMVGENSSDRAVISLRIEAMQNQTKDFGSFPIAKNAQARKTYDIPLTAYTSDPAQTDDTPCIVASGLDVCERNTEDIVAANFLPLGTRVRIPELYGDQIFYVQDRMNERYHYKMDIWMKDIKDAKQFGLKYATVEVF